MGKTKAKECLKRYLVFNFIAQTKKLSSKDIDILDNQTFTWTTQDSEGSLNRYTFESNDEDNLTIQCIRVENRCVIPGCETNWSVFRA
jgi:hypothetical protein